jgi:hypothetical protein
LVDGVGVDPHYLCTRKGHTGTLLGWNRHLYGRDTLTPDILLINRFGYEFLFTATGTSPFDMPFSLRPDMCYIFVQMVFPVFHEFDVDGTICTNGLHWEGFPRLAWEALSAAGYLTPPTYEVSEFERYGVPRCRVIVTVLPHPDHIDWSDLSFIY